MWDRAATASQHHPWLALTELHGFGHVQPAAALRASLSMLCPSRTTFCSRYLKTSPVIKSPASVSFPMIKMNGRPCPRCLHAELLSGAPLQIPSAGWPWQADLGRQTSVIRVHPLTMPFFIKKDG